MSYYLKKFWGANLLVIIMQIIVNFVQVSLSLVQMQLSQSIIDLHPRRFIFWVTVNFLGFVVAIFLGSLLTLCQGRAVRKMNNAVRRDIAATLLQKTYEEYHAQTTGEYLSWFTSGVSQIDQSGWQAFFSLTDNVAWAVFSMLMICTIHWSLLPLALVSSLVMIIVPKLFEKRLEQLGAACAQGQEAAVSSLKDLLGGYSILRFFGRGLRFCRGIDSASDQMEKPEYQKTYKQSFIYSCISVTNLANQVLVTCYAALLAIQKLIPIAAYFTTGQLCGNIFNGLRQISYYRLCFSTSKPYFSRITVHDSGKHPTASDSPKPVEREIAVENLTFRYGEKPVLHGMTFRFEKGGKYALTGPSGCGKSTLLKLLLGWLPDYEGTITFDGQNAKDYTPEQLQKQMSYIEQDVFLFNTTIRENITLGEDFTEEQMQKALQDSALAGDLAHMPLGLDTPVGEEGSALSGGQKQRVAIARALIHDRSILLVDEGTSALDQKNADIVEKSLLSNPDLTLILVSHHLTEERKAQFTRVFTLPGAGGS